MKKQSYSSRIRPGTELYEAQTWTEDDGKAKSEITIWVVRSIRAKRGSKTKSGCTVFYGDTRPLVNLVQKIAGLTWGKRSSKKGDFGFLKSISANYRQQFVAGGDLPTGLYTTVRGAILYEISSLKRRAAYWQKRIPESSDPEILAELQSDIKGYEAQIAVLKIRLARLPKRSSVVPAQ